MKYTPPDNALEAIWELIRLVLVVCMFFWFGLWAGIVSMLLLIKIGTSE